MTHVFQEDRSGCGIACVAMVVGKSYGEVRKTAIELGIIDEFLLIACGNGAGMNNKQLEALLWHYSIQPGAKINQVPVIPFHNPIIRSVNLGGHDGSHWIVVDGHGKIWDPAI